MGMGTTDEVEEATCLACGCLCDDIALTVAEGRIVEARNACEVGRAWFLADHQRADLPASIVEGRAVDLEMALDRAAAILQQARAPVVCGLSGSTTEAQGIALAIADRVGAVFDPEHSSEALPSVLATQRTGAASATLGEVRQRAEVVVFWGVDPIRTHPRLWERVIEPPGRFLRSGRVVLAADSTRTATIEKADLALIVDPDRQFDALWSLRALVRGLEVDLDRVRSSAGIDPEALLAWADRLQQARYGAFFQGPGPGGSAIVEALQGLVLDLNASARFVALPLLGPGNPAGAEAVATWQAGAPLAIEFRQGHPRFLPDDATASLRLERGEADAALIVGDSESFELSHHDSLGKIPVIRIGPAATARASAVAIASATPGIDTPGTVWRFDGVSLPLRPALSPIRPTDRELLGAILARIEAADRAQGQGQGR
ncbi:formylmethanofuran dehydrogenase subunit B [soil metagenome]